MLYFCQLTLVKNWGDHCSLLFFFCWVDNVWWRTVSKFPVLWSHWVIISLAESLLLEIQEVKLCNTHLIKSAEINTKEGFYFKDWVCSSCIALSITGILFLYFKSPISIWIQIFCRCLLWRRLWKPVAPSILIIQFGILIKKDVEKIKIPSVYRNGEILTFLWISLKHQEKFDAYLFWTPILWRVLQNHHCLSVCLSVGLSVWCFAERLLNSFFWFLAQC